MFPIFKARETAKVIPIWEAALPMNTSHDALRGHLRKALMAAHGVGDTYSDHGPWISDVFPKHVVYSHKGDSMKRSYTSADGAAGAAPTITLGEPKKVHVAYVNSSESATESMRVLMDPPPDMTEDWGAYTTVTGKEKDVIITLPPGVDMVVTESGTFCQVISDIKEAARSAAAAGKPTTIPIKIIGPGWGSMAHYSEAMIKASGPKTFKKGTQMFWNHATDTQEAERPEGDLNDLAAVLTKDAYWDANGLKGPGLYSEAKVFSDYATQVEEKGPHIGVSINAGIKAHEGEVEGRTGRIADAFVHAFSTDFVTKAGAGGAPIVPVTESARGSAPAQRQESVMAFTEAEVTALQTELTTLRAQNKVMEAQQNKILATATVSMLLREAGVEVKASILNRVCENPTMKEGKVCPEWAKAVATDLADVAESAGGVRGMGEGGQRTREAAGMSKDETAKFQESLKDLGISDAGLQYALKGGY